MNNKEHNSLPAMFEAETTLTMSSRDIADLCEARHNDVVGTIERLFENGVLRESRKTLRPYAPEGGGRPTQVYDLTKRDTLVVVSGYNDGVRARIIDRWMELEAAVVPLRGQTAHMVTSPRAALSAFKAYRDFGKLIGLDANQAILSANRATRKSYGFDLMAEMEVTHLIAPQQGKLLTSTDIGLELGGKSGMAVNAMLANAGLQMGKRDAKDRAYWEPTEVGKPFAVWQDTGKRHGDGTPVRQLKWTADVIAKIAEVA